MSHPRVVVIGAGVGGLATAALLARAGLDVTVLEAHIYAGGCAGTFYHKSYRFDAGATLAAGFYPGGPMDLLARAAGIESWPVRPADPAMMVHLPGGRTVACYGGEARWTERERVLPGSTPFWRWQEETAGAMWDLALRLPAWPPTSAADLARVAATGLGWLGDDLGHLRPGLVLDARRPLAAHLRSASQDLRLLVDAQLLISAQTTAPFANALYGAAALDLPRRGVAHVEGGMGILSALLVDTVRKNGGTVEFRQEVTRIVVEEPGEGRPVAVETKKGGSFGADVVIANLPPWNLVELLGERAPLPLRRLPLRPPEMWSAFMVYLGVDETVVPPGFPLHHQVILGQPPSIETLRPSLGPGLNAGEGNTVFLSISPAWDPGRAPAGRRALTLSSHTLLGPWWELHASDRDVYEARKEAYLDRVLAAAEVAIPGLREAADLVMPGTPVTFQRFTRRRWGWVGGFPQTGLRRAWSPHLAPGLWLVGDSIFPGQSIPAVVLGGLRVAAQVLQDLTGRRTTKDEGRG